ncbi:MAG: flagellar M-ring protein FliF [Defluviimonas sp.]|nr:flagellar M-ring protein FliF [Defluviimonas sp.]
MQQLVAVWQALDTRRRMVVAGATAAMFAAVLLLSGLAGGGASMALLYAGLEGRGAAEVIAALDARAVPYEVRGDAIYVEAKERDSLRMALAGEGLPATGGAGYELLDSLSGFGTTAQMFDAAYWRAKEGELARTIVASPQIRSARVHIAVPVGQPFREDRRPGASIAVTTAAGMLPPAHAKALKFLVASAVAGMTPEDVSVIDADSGTVIAGDDGGAAQGGEDRATQIKRNVERLLEARVGHGRAVVEVSVDTVTEREAITERRFDPQGRVAISTETEERSNSARDSKAGAVTVASNLPEGAGTGGGDSQSNESETRERTNYEVSETTRELLRSPGAIRRLSVAVLVDGVQITDAAGEASWQPRPDEEIAMLRELVASAVGFDEARGDSLTIRSLPFEAGAMEGTAAGPGLFTMPPLDVMQLAQVAVLSVVALVLGLFVLRPILAGAPGRQVPELASPAGPPALTGEIDEGDFTPGNMAVVSDFGDGGGLPALGTAFAVAGGGPDEDPVARLRRLIAERQEETAEILRGWMEQADEEKV